MTTTEELPEEWTGCQGVMCPLASELRTCTQHVRRMETQIKTRFSRMSLVLKMMAEAFEEIPDIPPVSPSTTKTEDAIRECIQQLMNEKDGSGKNLFKNKSHWQAIYRIIVDKGLGIADGDYAGFERLVRWIQPDNCRVPFSLYALKHITNTNFTKPFSKWVYDKAYFKKRKPYDDMVAVAIRFRELLEERGL